MRATYLAGWALVCAATAIGCTSGGGGDGATGGVGGGGGTGGGGDVCARAATKLRDCGLATPGVLESCTEPDGAAEVCESSCYLDAACGDLEMDLCANTTTGGLATCLTTCEAQNSFDCGAGESVSTRDQCDGFDDCSNAADEVGCPQFACGDGDMVPVYARCDGWEDCTNGGDETGCPTFTCGDGATIPADYQCDGGTPDCADGSDEVGCPAALTPICN